MLDNSNELINDDEYVALKILNNEEVTIDSKKEYIGLLHTQIEEIEAFKKQIDIISLSLICGYDKHFTCLPGCQLY